MVFERDDAAGLRVVEVARITTGCTLHDVRSERAAKGFSGVHYSEYTVCHRGRETSEKQ